MAHRILSFLLIAIIFSSTTTAQSKQQRKIAASVEALRKAMVDADKTMLEEISMDSLSYGHSGGKIEDKATFVENIVNGNSDFVTIELTNQTITVSGKTAIVRHIFNATTNDKGKGPGAVKLAVMTVWQNDKKEWKMLARQAVKLP
ncbi:MAG: nuclear transport factor 2 family protein [Ferruginibacter sp.]|nr:nuclear transport factor 2 family protein [Ferruginibacter sp.]